MLCQRSIATTCLLQNFLEEADHQVLIPCQLLIPWEVVDVYEVEQVRCRPSLMLPLPRHYDVKIEEVQSEVLPQSLCQLSPNPWGWGAHTMALLEEFRAVTVAQGPALCGLCI